METNLKEPVNGKGNFCSSFKFLFPASYISCGLLCDTKKLGVAHANANYRI